tara:strand:+ start:18965 stop:20047 length:1083 start_codon:yes stop_codon:yes gene_type:complete
MHNFHETILEIDLRKLENNFNFLSSKLKENCKIIAVVKAFGYGHGDIEISKKLEQLGVYALWVADFEEGIRLRDSGIRSKIIVANPGWKSFNEIVKYNLEVVIHNCRLLDFYISKGKDVNIHLKFNTGMNRYGFDKKDISFVVNKLKNNSNLKVKSICSHLSSAGDTTKLDVSKKQINLFNALSKTLEEKLNKKIERHILNSNGFMNFPESQMNMVRLGISLYGSYKNTNLQQISKLKSVISQNRNIKKGEGVGYSSDFIAKKTMNISVVPVGYADGLNRKLGNSVGSVIIKEVECPIIGNICMDSLMIDTSKVDCKEGDEVVIFGPKNTILSLSEKIGTIPYEIYSSLNRRIKRVYIDN